MTSFPVGTTGPPQLLPSRVRRGTIPRICVIADRRWPLALGDVGGWVNPGAGPSRLTPRHLAALRARPFRLKCCSAVMLHFGAG